MKEEKKKHIILKTDNIDCKSPKMKSIRKEIIQKEYYNFFEWNKKDSIVNIKKIPLFIVNNDVFNSF